MTNAGVLNEARVEFVGCLQRIASDLVTARRLAEALGEGTDSLALASLMVRHAERRALG